MHTTSAIAITLLIIITAGICATAAAETGNPDLVVEGVSAPSEAVTGGRISLQATVRNTGDDTAPLFTACFFLSEDTVYDALDISLGRAQGASLRPASGKSVTLSASIPSRSGGPCYIIVKADCADQVREEDETNNIGTSSLIMVGSPSSSGKIPVTLPTPVPGTPAIVPTKTPSLLPTIIPGIPATLPTKTPSLSPTTIPGNERTPSPEPDLVITGISVPASVAPGTRAGVSITIRNQGNASASSSSLSLSLSGDRTLDPGDTSAGQVMVSPIAPGVTRTVSSSVRIPDGATGTCSLCARADANSRISESDEENNGACSMAIL
ncbi:MAG TPA: CARDB domain-containing protein, partial [Methanoregulaceae archaeon]|nr:CARDB domain-containing protein [Methanoregulaceae archaeon]